MSYQRTTSWAPVELPGPEPPVTALIPEEDPNANASITAIDAMIAPRRGAEFNGDVVIRQNERSFKARSARIDYETDTLYLEEGVLIQDSDLCIEGRRAEGRLLSGEGLIESADRKSTRLNSSHSQQSRMPSSA